MKNRSSIFFRALIAVLALLTVTISGQDVTPSDKEKAGDSLAAQMDAAKAAERRSDYKGAVDAYNRVLEIDPDNYQAHIALINASEQVIIRPYAEKPGFGKDEQAMKEMGDKLKPLAEAKKKKYERLAKAHPNKAVYQLLLAYIYVYEPLKYQGYLAEAQRLDPENREVLKQLASFEKLKGNNVKASEIYKKIYDIDPKDEEAAFRYAYSFAEIDQQEFKEKTAEFIQRFPKSERIAQLYYGIASKGLGPERIEYLEKLRRGYPPDKNHSSMMGMYELFSIYLTSKPGKAKSFAQEMHSSAGESAKKDWQELVDFLTSYQMAERLVNEKQPARAIETLKNIKIPTRYQVANEATVLINLLKARAVESNGQAASAYDELKTFFVNNPSDEVRRELSRIGTALGKREERVQEDIQAAVASLAKPITDFSLGRYDADMNVSMADYRGRVVMLNFWYPLCGPCHAEAPYLQKLIDKYGKDKFVILSPNGIPNQDSLVMPYFTGNKFDFIPLKVPSDEWAKTQYQVRGYPTNYLIDKKGNKVFNIGRVGINRYRQVELMLELLLQQNP